MSTRSVIFIRYADGTLTGAHRHSDGQPRRVGGELIEIYEDRVEMGDDDKDSPDYIDGAVGGLIHDLMNGAWGAEYEWRDDLGFDHVEYTYVISPLDNSIVIYGGWEAHGIKFRLDHPVDYIEFFNGIGGMLGMGSGYNDGLYQSKAIEFFIKQFINKSDQKSKAKHITFDMMKDGSAWAFPLITEHATPAKEVGEYGNIEL